MGGGLRRVYAGWYGDFSPTYMSCSCVFGMIDCEAGGGMKQVDVQTKGQTVEGATCVQ